MNPYSVLGLQSGASEDEAKVAFRKLAKTCHPDLNPNNPAAEQRFKEISAAYDMICNPPPPPPQFQFHTSHFRFDDVHFGNSPFDDLFANLRNYTRQQRNPDIHMECRINLVDVFYGKEFELTSPSHSNPRTFRVKIPQGIEEGMNLRISGAGDHSNKALPAGDLYLVVRINAHQNLLRSGRNLTTIVPVTAFDVMLGKDIEVMGIDGKTLRIPIPPEFDSSRKLRLAGQGMVDAAGRGDLFIELYITFPALNDAQRALLVQAEASRDRTDQ